jgi:uncharacterized protein YdaU (DUF1376 family)
MKHQWMPLFWGDFFANTLHLTAQETGAYILLIGHAWEHDGNIAVGDLQRVARINNYHWPKVRDRLAPFFNTSDVSNIWHHARVTTELTLAAEISNKRKGAALQMHANRAARANAHASTPLLHHLFNPSLNKENGAAREAPNMQMQMKRDSDDSRFPPRTKSDNVLKPLPEKQRSDRKKASE